MTTLTSEFYVLTAIHKQYNAGGVIAQLVSTTFLFGVAELVKMMHSQTTASDADKIKRELHDHSAIADALKRYEIWSKDDITIICRGFSVSLSTKVESELRTIKRRIE